MQRPILNPVLFHPGPAAPRKSWTAMLAGIIGRTLRLAANTLTFDLLPFHRQRRMILGAPRAARCLRSILRWVTFMPMTLALLCAALVYLGTHPNLDGPWRDPLSQGIYFDSVSFTSADGTRLDGWLVPVVNAARVLAEGESVLIHRHPALVLVPDTGAPREQLLPLVASLHDAGYILLVINPRGNETIERVGSTFGLRESLDVQSAVNMLRRRPFVEPGSVGVIGIGAGANAALLAAQHDRTIETLTLIAPRPDADQIVAERLAPKQPWLAWFQPMCKWTFELAYQVDLDELNVEHFSKILQSPGTLQLSEGEALRLSGRTQVCEFLSKRFAPAKTPALADTK